MEKFSFYNVFVPFHKRHTILYNSISGFYGLLTPRTCDILRRYENDVARLSVDYPEIYAALRNNGCIVPEEIDEFQTVETIKYERRFNCSQYQVIINPTMDCNLGCWYCYEQHIPDSEISDSLTRSIVAHLHFKYNKNPFKVLFLCFFGGEPMLKEKKILELLDGAESFCKTSNVNLLVDFTTNCTILSDTMLERLKDFNVSFQITLDGDKTKHDEVRHYKNSKAGSYDKILSNLRRITDNLVNYQIRLRINCDNKTLRNRTDLLDGIDFLDRKKSVIAIHRVWQIDEKSMDKSRILQFVDEASRRNFKVEFMQLACLKEHICYADLFNEAVINYNGDVFKCTAREFLQENREGVLTDSGQIVWDIDKIRKRAFLATPEICKECKLYPACTGFCSQHLIEVGNMQQCRTLRELPLEEHVTINFQHRYLQKNFVRL